MGLAAKKIEEIERSVVQEAPLQIEAVADLRRAESLIKVLDATFVTINAVFDPAWRRSSEPPSGFWEKMFRGNTNELNIYQRPKDISSFVDKEKKAYRKSGKANCRWRRHVGRDSNKVDFNANKNRVDVHLESICRQHDTERSNSI